MIEALKDRAQLGYVMARERAQQVASIRVETSSSIGRVILYGLVGLLVLILFTTLQSWFTEHRVNREWRQRIAQASSAVRAAVGEGAKAAEAADAAIINTLGVSDAKLRIAEKLLLETRDSRDSNGCPRIPARCVRE
jgi:hypothetical protein